MFDILGVRIGHTELAHELFVAQSARQPAHEM